MTADDRLKEYRKAVSSRDFAGCPRGRLRGRRARRRRLEARREGSGGQALGTRTRLSRGVAAPALAAVLAAVLVLALAAAPPASATAPDERGRIDPELWASLEGIARYLREEKWRTAGRWTNDLLATSSRDRWHEPDLGRVLATLTFYRAVLAAHRGEERAALWDWHAALNLDPAQGERDLAPYGRAAELFTERSLRREGKAPSGVDVPEPYASGAGYQPAVPVVPEKRVMMVNKRFGQERVPTVAVELLVGPDGQLAHPVVTTPWAHPVAIWWTLEAMGQAGPFEPARLDGKAVPALLVLEQDFGNVGKF